MTILNTLWIRLISFGFYLLYHQLAPAYDWVSWIVSFGKWRNWQLAALPFVKGADVLELAHGPGHMLLALAHAGHTVTGTDLSPQMVRLAKQKIQTAGASVSILQAPAQNLPIASASIDTVLATFPTEFIAEQATLEEVHRVLRRDGRFVIIPQARLVGDTFPVKLLEGLYRITGQRNFPDTIDGPQTAAKLLVEMQKRFNEAGFSVQQEHVLQAGSEVTILLANRQDAQS